jgi:hypothetical protein
MLDHVNVANIRVINVFTDPGRFPAAQNPALLPLRSCAFAWNAQADELIRVAGTF